MRKAYYKMAVPGILIAGIMFFISACAPTYPRERLAEAIKDVCKAEYGMEVDAILQGDTVGIYHSMPGLLDGEMGISKDAWEKISSLILIASRVALSTDADIQFYCVITQDPLLPELQVVIIKYVDDVKMSMFRNISREESFKRTLFSVNLTPQAQKERSVESIFGQMGVDEKTREKVLNEFFRSEPTKLSDIGYWRGNFYLKDITVPEFLAAQMANRIKIDFRSEKDLAGTFVYKSSEGAYDPSLGARHFLVNFNIDQTGPVSRSDPALRETKISNVLQIVKDVVYGYKFEDFDFVFMNDQSANVRLKVLKDDVFAYTPGRISVRDIVQAPSGYFL